MSKVADWLVYAENDLKTAKAALGENVTNNACFHAQQTVEKCLKALLLSEESETPRTHDLLFLLSRARSHKPELLQFDGSVRFLNQFYTPSRYPDAFPGSAQDAMPTKEDAEKSIKFAEEVFNFMKSQISLN